MGKDFPSSLQWCVGKRVRGVHQSKEGEEGIRIVFDDGSFIEVMFNMCEGDIEFDAGGERIYLLTSIYGA